MQLVERRSLNYSVILHVVAVFMMLVGIPILLPAPPDPTPLVMSVELLPISEISNVKPSDKPIQKEQNAPAKPVKAPVTPPPPKPPTPTPAKSEPKPAPTPEKPEPKPFDPMEGAEPLKDKPKETPKDQPKTEDPLDKLLKDLKKEQDSKPVDKTPVKPAKAAPAVKAGTDKTTVEENKTKSDAPYDSSIPMSMSEKDAIKSQFIPNWNPPIGAKDAASLVVRVKVEFDPDGTVKTAVIAPDLMGRYNSDPFFRAAADSALRAVHKTHQLKNVTPDKYSGKEGWNSMEITFDPSLML